MSLREKFDSIINQTEELVGSGEHNVSDISQAVAMENGLDLCLLADAFRFMTDIPK